MIKKAHIIFLVFLFFGSTTSLPITIHLCNMMSNMDMKTCKMDMPKDMNKMNCPLNTHAKKEIKTVYKNLPCCVSYIKDIKLKDDFVQSTSNIEKELKYKRIEIQNFSDFNSDISVSILNVNINSPPHRIDNHIYLSFSLLLI